MARAGSTLKGASTPDRAAAIFQAQAREARRSDSAFVLYVERLIAFGFPPHDRKSVLIENGNTFRDLPPTTTRPRSPFKQGRAPGAAPEARRAEITPAVILSKRTDRTLNEALESVRHF